ncbi:BTAD domain-containing putative transcriptional regulator, partial [Streptomyces sp. NPDC055189]
RRGEALSVYQRLRQALVRDLGLEPSPELRRLQQAILKTSEPTPHGARSEAANAGARDRLARVG